MLLLKFFKQIKPLNSQKLLPGVLNFNFAKLPSVVDIKKSELEENFQGYYEDILRVAKTTKSGRIHVETHHLSKLIDK